MCSRGRLPPAIALLCWGAVLEGGETASYNLDSGPELQRTSILEFKVSSQLERFSLLEIRAYRWTSPISNSHFCLKKHNILFIYLFLIVLGLCCRVDLSLVAVSGSSSPPAADGLLLLQRRALDMCAQ